MIKRCGDAYEDTLFFTRTIV